MELITVSGNCKPVWASSLLAQGPAVTTTLLARYTPAEVVTVTTGPGLTSVTCSLSLMTPPNFSNCLCEERTPQHVLRKILHCSWLVLMKDNKDKNQDNQDDYVYRLQSPLRQICNLSFWAIKNKMNWIDNIGCCEIIFTKAIVHLRNMVYFRESFIDITK